MIKSGVKGQRLVALFLLGGLLFNYPLLDLFNRPSEFFQVPLLFAYIFGAWALLIGLMAIVAERETPRQETRDTRGQ